MVWLGVIVEVGWVSGLKYADSFLTWSLTIVAIYLSMHALLVATRSLPVGTTYAVFTGMGTAGTVITEAVVFGEPLQGIKILLISILLIGVIGLKMVSNQKSVEGEKG
ncbi:DMT family transporter [Ornithinibacillus contaminans]|uniref:DMT family transporter n=1 Tax=Ornithinibacillus contaminans TaxID=694055 RepID=UPI001F0299E1|nr:SMR family transporter [Ornithinibacillus contaminans]